MHRAGRESVRPFSGFLPLQTVSAKFRLSAIIKIARGVVKFQMAKL